MKVTLVLRISSVTFWWKKCDVSEASAGKIIMSMLRPLDGGSLVLDGRSAFL
jgi:hypothetical protein